MQTLDASCPDIRTTHLIMECMTDVSAAHHVEVQVSENGSKLWINVNEVCILRIDNIASLRVEPGPGVKGPGFLKRVFLPAGVLHDRRKR